MLEPVGKNVIIRSRAMLIFGIFEIILYILRIVKHIHQKIQTEYASYVHYMVFVETTIPTMHAHPDSEAFVVSGGDDDGHVGGHGHAVDVRLAVPCPDPPACGGRTQITIETIAFRWEGENPGASEFFDKPREHQ